MRTEVIGKSGLLSSRFICGCMYTAGTANPVEVDSAKREKARQFILTAREAGINHFDHADIYCRGLSEQVFGELLRDTPSLRRNEIIITTKCGIRKVGDPDAQAPHRYDLSKQHVLWSAEQSLQRLGVDAIDIYLLHRPDLLMDPAEIAEAFGQLHAQGKVRYFGVSNFRPEQLEALAAMLPMSLVCHQVEIHPGRLDAFTDGTLDQCMRLGITPTAWSPLWGGRLGDGWTPKPDDPRKEIWERVVPALNAEAATLGITRAPAAVAWLLKHPSHIMPIIGTMNPQHIRDLAAADAIDMPRETWYRIYLAARGKSLR